VRLIVHLQRSEIFRHRLDANRTGPPGEGLAGTRVGGQAALEQGIDGGYGREVGRSPEEATMDTNPRTDPYRDRFHDALNHLEGNLQAQGILVRAALARATRGLVTGNTALCGAVVAGDDEVDRRYLDIERQVIDLLGRHASVAADLRLLTAILHINRHLERIGDMAVNVAQLGQVVADAPRNRRWTTHLEQMSEQAVWMVELAMQAFGARDAMGSQRLPTLDERVDELNRSLLAAMLAPGQPLDQLAWVVHLHDAGRQLERAADHAVDIAEQVWFLVTGELVEFDDPPIVPAPAS
jgi:phosphate transport system protein